MASVNARSPLSVACVGNLPLDKESTWIDARLQPGATYRLRALLEGTPTTEDIAALVCFDMAEVGGGGAGLRLSRHVGAHFYFRTGPGLHLTDRVFSVDSPVSRIGVMTWGDRGNSTIKTMTIEPVTGAGQPTSFFLSFDVEAGKARAPGNPIDTLIWGKIGEGEYGIRRICRVLQQYGIQANFLVDYATCTADGERAAHEIVDYLASRGHEIHPHLHPEHLFPRWGVRHAAGAPTQLDQANFDLSRRLLEHTVWSHLRFVGTVPRVFRSGSYRMNAELILAAGSLGIEALSNAQKDTVGDPAIAGDRVRDREMFRWENGVTEIPVDASSPEAGDRDSYLELYERAMCRKRNERTFNIVMHSWSLTRRNAETRKNDAFEPAYETRLHEICEHAMVNGGAYGYGEYLDQRSLPLPVVRLGNVRTDIAPPTPIHVNAGQVATCNVCDATFSPPPVASGPCPGCGLPASRRCLKHAIDTFGNMFDGRRVLTLDLGRAERRAFLAGATEIVMISALEAESNAADAEPAALSDVADESVDCVMAIDLLESLSEGGLPAAMSSLARVLTQRGLVVTLVPPTVVDGATGYSAEFGLAESSQYGYTSAHDSRLRRFRQIVSPEFKISLLPGLDPITNTSACIALCYKHDDQPGRA